MPKVGIVMGSDSDLKVMSKAADMLEKLGIDYEMTIISAHRMPDVFFDWAKAAEGKGIKVIIAGAGMAAHLPGMCAVATVAIDGGMNAAILAAKILATSDEEVLKKLKAYSEEMKETVQKKAEKLDEIGYQAYLEK